MGINAIKRKRREVVFTVVIHNPHFFTKRQIFNNKQQNDSKMSNFNFKLSLTTQPIEDKNVKANWANSVYHEVTTTPNELINYLSKGYAFCHLFRHSGDTFDYNERINVNFIGSQVIAIDIDHTDVTYWGFCDIMANSKIMPTIIYTTQNNMIKGNRYRALYVLDTAVNGELYKSLYTALTDDYKSLLGIDTDNAANKLNQQFAGNCTDNFEYRQGPTYTVESLCHRYGINAATDDYTTVNEVLPNHAATPQHGRLQRHDHDDTDKVQSSAIYSDSAKVQSSYIISGAGIATNGDTAPYSQMISKSIGVNNAHNAMYKDTTKSIDNRYTKKGPVHYAAMKKVQSSYIKKEKEHYSIGLHFLESVDKSRFIADFEDSKMSIADIVMKYIHTFGSKEVTDVPHDVTLPYYDVPSDYIAIRRQWAMAEETKHNGTTYRHCVAIRCKNGQGRRHRLFINLILRRFIWPSISFDNLLYNAVYELHTYIDNTDVNDLITKMDVANIAVNAFFEDLDKYTHLVESYKRPKYKICGEFCRDQGISKRQVQAMLLNDMAKKRKADTAAAIAKYYNADWSIAENVQYLNDMGVKISKKTLQNWKKENGYTRTYTKRKSKPHDTANGKGEPVPTPINTPTDTATDVITQYTDTANIGDLSDCKAVNGTMYTNDDTAQQGQLYDHIDTLNKGNDTDNTHSNNATDTDDNTAHDYSDTRTMAIAN